MNRALLWTIVGISAGIGRGDELPAGAIRRMGGPDASERHAQPLRSAGYSADGKEVITRCEQKVLRWDAESGKYLGRLEAPPGASSFLVTNDGRWMISTSPNATIQVFDAQTRTVKHTISLGVGGGYTYGLAGDSRTLVIIARETPSILLFDLITAEKKGELPLPTAPDREATPGALPRRLISARHGKLIGAGTPSHLAIWDVGCHRRIQAIAVPQDRVLRHAAISPDGRWAILDLYGDDVAIWELASGTIRFRLSPFANNGKDYQDPSVRQEIDGQRYPLTVAVSPDGRLVARTGEDAQIRLFDARTGKELAALAGHKPRTCSIAFSPNSMHLVSGGVDGTALVWDMKDARSKMANTAGKVDPGRLESLWALLGEGDAAKAWPGIDSLAGDPAAALALARQHLGVAKPPDEAQVKKLIEELNDGRFAVRRKAQRELEQMGDAATPALKSAAADNPSVEVKKQAQRLLDGLAIRPLTPAEVRETRLVEALERSLTPESLAFLKQLAAGAPTSTLTRAAAAVLERQAPAEPK